MRDSERHRMPGDEVSATYSVSRTSISTQRVFRFPQLVAQAKDPCGIREGDESEMRVGGIWATFVNSGGGISTPEIDVPSPTAGSKVLDLSKKHHTSKRCMFTFPSPRCLLFPPV